MRITTPVTMASDVAQGNTVTQEVVPEGFWVRVGGKPNMSLAHKIKACEPQVHGVSDGR